MKKLLVLGVGNILMQDEGFGVHVINAFWKEKEIWKDADVDFIDGGTFTQDIFYLFEAYEKVLVLDIVRANQTPGTIFILEEHQLRQDKKQMLSLHDIDLLDSLGMAEMRGHRPYLRVVGIEPATIDWGTQLTPPLAAAFHDYLKIVQQQIIKLLGASDKD